MPGGEIGKDPGLDAGGHDLERFDDARLHCEALAAQHGYRYIHSGNEPLLVAGVATVSLEMLEEEPGLEVLIVPVGAGSGAAGEIRSVSAGGGRCAAALCGF